MNQPQTPKFCIDCAHHIPTTHEDNKLKTVPVCRVAQMIDLVSGTKFFPACQEMRDPQAPCSTAAKLFTPIIAVLPPAPSVAPEPGLN